MQELLTFQKFASKEEATELVTILKTHKIVYVLEDHSSRVDANIFGQAATKEFRIKIQKKDFEKADHLLQSIFLKELEQVDPNHYLFEFSDDELFEIVTEKDQWSQYDYLLAQKILKERGKEINPEIIQLLTKRRMVQLSKPDESQKAWVFAGYAFAALGGLLGVVIGLHLLTHKKTLPNGDRVYAHTKSDRAHGNRITIIGFIMILVSIAIRFWAFSNDIR